MALDNAEMIFGAEDPYPWAMEFWKRAQQMHWLADEVPMGDDVKQYKTLNPRMRSAIDMIFLFFTQADVEVQDCYHQRYSAVFKPVSVKMMLSAFSNMETIHVHAYRHLLDTLGIPSEQAHAFKEYQEMVDAADWFRSFEPTDAFKVAETLAAVSGFGEGLKLFGSFAFLMNLPRQNLMKGMGQIVSWSVRDETLHCQGMMKVFHTWLREHPEIDRAALKVRIEEIAREAVHHEDKFIDLVFAKGDIPGMTAAELKRYIRWIANQRMRELGYWDIYPDVTEDPLPWVYVMAFGQEHANFFEQKGTEYSKAAAKGDWD